MQAFINESKSTLGNVNREKRNNINKKDAWIGFTYMCEGRGVEDSSIYHYDITK